MQLKRNIYFGKPNISQLLSITLPHYY